ncbi:Methyltransferase type 11 domain-containing protein [Candidatus Electrothrix aarhusensis]
MTQKRLKQHDFEFQENLYEISNPTRGWLHSRRREWVSQAIEKYSSQCQQVKYLEIGLGCGVYTKIISKKGIVTAIDINEDFVERASRLENVSARVADIQSTSFEPIYDVALCSEVIEHLSDSEITIKHIYLSLKPGGYLILTTPNKYSTVELAARILTIPYLRRFIQKLYKEPVDDLGHINRLTQRKLKEQICNAKFSIVHQENLAFYLPVIGEFGGSVGLSICKTFERIINVMPVFSWLLWTQCWVLQKTHSNE